MIELLNKCFLAPKEPSFYDTDAKSLQELLSNFHAKLNELSDGVNEFRTRMETRMEEFLDADEKAKEEHMSAMRQEFQDFIDIINLKVMECETMMKTSLDESIHNMLVTMKDSGELDETILDALGNLNTTLTNEVEERATHDAMIFNTFKHVTKTIQMKEILLDELDFKEYTITLNQAIIEGVVFKPYAIESYRTTAGRSVMYGVERVDNGTTVDFKIRLYNPEELLVEFMATVEVLYLPEEIRTTLPAEERSFGS